jgi:hypothetical protein
MDNQFKYVPTEMKQINTFHTPPWKEFSPIEALSQIQLIVYEDILSKLEACTSKVDLIEVMKDIKTKILELKTNG